MIYKNFYIKYKMSDKINLDVSIENNKDIENNHLEVSNGEKGEGITPEVDEKLREVLLQLGDIILITDPTNEILNEQIFLIEYIDTKKIKLINSETFEKTILQISSDGIIGDGNIKAIKIISNNVEKGYARQNELLPGTWINIYFGGDIPTVITGKITNLEEDMIEIKTTDNDTLFINFNYQGIPEDLPIETFEIRPALMSDTNKNNNINNESPEDNNNINDKLNEDNNDINDISDINNIDNISNINEKNNVITQNNVMPKSIVKEKIQKIMFDMNDIEFGDIVNVEEYVTVDKEKYRYNIEAQTNDMLEEMISSIPNSKRTNNVLNNIHTIIMRFIQLRKITSTFDVNKNVTGMIKITAEDRPLAEYLSQFKNTLYWIMMVAKNVKKIYPDEDESSENVQIGDYEIIDMNDDLLNMETSFKNYKVNRGVEGQNKYSNLYYSLDQYLTPFYSPHAEEKQDVFSASNGNGTIIEGNVETDINAIIDNLGDLYSTIVSGSEISIRKFVIQRYNLGQEKLEPINLKGSKIIAHRVKLTQNDPIAINSIITLPEPTVRFSQINLPGTNLLVRANLNMHFLNYWEMLKQKTKIQPIIIDGLDNELEYDDTNFVDNIKQYLLDLSDYQKPEELTNLEIYKVFLKTIIPKIRVLFKLVKKYIKGRLSLVDVVNYLEPFLIYPIDLTYMQYTEINKFIVEKIKEYNTLFKEYSVAFSSIKYLRTKVQYNEKNQNQNQLYVYSNELFNLLDSDNHQLKIEVFNDYELSTKGQMLLSPSEFIKNVTLADFGNLFNTAIALTNIKLMYPSGLSKVFDNDLGNLKQIMEKDKANDKCSSYIIAKKYYSINALLEDNDKTIYFDKEFDTTNYALIGEKYKKQRDELTSEEFIIYLTDVFKTTAKMDEASAEYMATTLVNQAKKVREGDYALLTMFEEGTDNADKLDYYVRTNDTWVIDNKVDSSAFIKEDDVLCNMEFNCMYNPAEKMENKCISGDVSKDTVINNALKQVLDQFDKNYETSKDELNSRITTQLNYFRKSYDRLQNIKRTHFFKNNKQQYELGLLVEDDVKNIVVSPYVKLRDLIMGQNDFVKRQTDIITFVRLYCREGDPQIPNINDGEMENEWWMYCVKTSTKLLPKFLYILADTFITKNSQYDDVLNELKRKIGKRSDDGDAWVDENSGEIICYIDLDVSEGYTADGFVNKSRSILEKDAGDIMLENQQNKKDKKEKRLSPEGELASNVVSVLSSNMGIDIEQSRDFIIKVVTELMNDTKVLAKETAYRKMEEEAAKKGRKMASYGKVFSSTLLYLTLGTYLIAIQTSIPSIKTRKTAPGCVRSFTGFPFEGEGDNSGLNYVACVALKSRDPSTIPWIELPTKEEKIEAILKPFITRYLLPYAEIEQKIRLKTEYLLANPDTGVPDEYNLVKWTNFLPPLKKFHINHLENITDGFRDDLHVELKNGSNKQLEKLLVIDSKIISYSLAVQETIQKLVEKKNLLLRSAGQLFMDNACCNEGDKTFTTLQYFENEDKNISFYNTIVAELSAIVHDIKILTNSAIMLSEVNTKRAFPKISNDFSEETVYHAFISMCKFQSNVPLAEDLLAICIDKPDYLKKMDTIQEKIAKLKRDGRIYTTKQFIRLFQLVSRNNIINTSLRQTNDTYVSNLQKTLSILDEEDNEHVSKSFVQKLDKLVQNFDVIISEDVSEMREIKNYLQTSIEKMRKELLSFIQINAQMSRLELVNITTFLNKLTEWRFDNNRNADIKVSDDGLNNSVAFLKNFVSLFAVTFPTMIINQQMQTINVPLYWGLSKDHEKDIGNMISKFYGPIETFYGNTEIQKLLAEVKNVCRGIYLLSETTPIGETHSVFDKRTVTLLYEYYILSVFSDYVNLTNDPEMVARLLTTQNKDADLFSSDFLISQQMRFTAGYDEEQNFIVEGNVMRLKKDVAKLITAYLTIMMRSKKTINVSYADVEDTLFKLKEGEKYDFTKRLKDLNEEAREIDTIFKHFKLGDIYSIGLSKGVKEYDPETFDHDKKVAERVALLNNKSRRVNRDVDEIAEDMDVEREEAEDLARNVNTTDDYDDGDPWGEEMSDREDYD